MGWGSCGTDSKGRPIGYSHPATCDHKGCRKKIDRGLGYACGGMHGSADTCEGYFCEDHMKHAYVPGEGGWKQVCFACDEELTKERNDQLFHAIHESLHSPPGEEGKPIVEWMEAWDEFDEVPESHTKWLSESARARWVEQQAARADRHQAA